MNECIRVCLRYSAGVTKYSSFLVFKCSLRECESTNCDLKCVCVCEGVWQGGVQQTGRRGEVKRG